MSQNNTETQPSNSKFQPCQVVRIRVPREGEDPGSPVPAESARGKTGIVEMEGRVYVANTDSEDHLEQAYFVRIEGIGPVLAGEGWIEDAQPI